MRAIADEQQSNGATEPCARLGNRIDQEIAALQHRHPPDKRDTIICGVHVGPHEIVRRKQRIDLNPRRVNAVPDELAFHVLAGHDDRAIAR